MAGDIVNEELAELLKEEKPSMDPELMKLVLLLANKALDKSNLKTDEDGLLMVRNMNF